MNAMTAVFLRAKTRAPSVIGRDSPRKPRHFCILFIHLCRAQASLVLRHMKFVHHSCKAHTIVVKDVVRLEAVLIQKPQQFLWIPLTGCDSSTPVATSDG